MANNQSDFLDGVTLLELRFITDEVGTRINLQFNESFLEPLMSNYEGFVKNLDVEKVGEFVDYIFGSINEHMAQNPPIVVEEEIPVDVEYVDENGNVVNINNEKMGTDIIQ